MYITSVINHPVFSHVSFIWAHKTACLFSFIDITRLRLIFGHKELVEDNTLGFYSIQNNDVIVCVIRMPGGGGNVSYCIKHMSFPFKFEYKTSLFIFHHMYLYLCSVLSFFVHMANLLQKRPKEPAPPFPGVILMKHYHPTCEIFLYTFFFMNDLPLEPHVCICTFCTFL